MDGRFIEAFTLLHKQRSVCGYTIRHLCLRHRLLLEAFKSPFLNDPLKSKPIDVIIAARVFSQNDLINPSDFKATDEDRKWMDAMIADGTMFLAQISSVSNFINENAKWPVFWSANAKKKHRDRGIPWVLNVVCNLAKNGIPLEQAWTMPECQAVWMHSAFAIGEGSDIDIISEDDLEAIKFAKALNSKKEPNG